MEGFLLTLFTQEHRIHEGMPLAKWILELAREMGVRGATLTSATTGFGHDGRLHSDRYFDLEDRPQQVTMALGPQELEQIMSRLAKEELNIFYTKTPISFGFTDTHDPV